VTTDYVENLWLTGTAAGQPAAVAVNRFPISTGGQTARSAAYVGISDTMEGQGDPHTGAYMYYATLNRCVAPIHLGITETRSPQSFP
jgi:hypothetical protein